MPVALPYEDQTSSGTRESIASAEVSSLVQASAEAGASVRNEEGSHLQRGLRVLSNVEAKIWTLALAPLVLSPLLFYGGDPRFPAPAARTLGTTILIATYWSTEVLPLAVTAMLPLVLLPLLGVQPGKDVARSYFQDTNLLFLGGLMVASAIEKANLHRRIALRVLVAVGTEPRQLYLGFMVACGFLSMWISNTAATAMMIPIARTLIKSIEEADANPVSSPPSLPKLSHEAQSTGPDTPRSLPASPIPVALDDQQNNEEVMHSLKQRADSNGPTPLQLYTKGLLLSIAYASSIGGIATLTGTGPNLVLSGAITKIFPGAPEISFTKWMAFACPVSIALMLIVWTWMCYIFASPRRRGLSDGGGQLVVLPTVSPEEVRRQYHLLGPLSYQERMVLGHFIVLTFLWIMRNPLVVPGWGALFKDGYATDSTAAIAVTIALFIAPARPPVFIDSVPTARPRVPARPNGDISNQSRGQSQFPMPRCLDWETAVNIPWGVIMLLGGGFAIADAFDASGLNNWLGCQLMIFQDLPPALAVLVVCFVITFTTEFTSNTATCTIAMPVLSSLSQAMAINPMVLLVPGTIAASFAFMLPVATAPNAIAFAGGELEVRDMARPGLVANLCGVLVTTSFMLTWGEIIWGDQTQPAWAIPVPSNTTENGC